MKCFRDFSRSRQHFEVQRGKRAIACRLSLWHDWLHHPLTFYLSFRQNFHFYRALPSTPALRAQASIFVPCTTLCVYIRETRTKRWKICALHCSHSECRKSDFMISRYFHLLINGFGNLNKSVTRNLKIVSFLNLVYN